jgi:hypothetical protein
MTVQYVRSVQIFSFLGAMQIHHAGGVGDILEGGLPLAD